MDYDLKNEAKHSFSSLATIIGVITCAISLLRIVWDALTLPRSVFLSNIFAAYKAVFHSIIDNILFFFPFTLPFFIKDVIVIYFIIAFAVIRTVRPALLGMDKYRLASLRWKYIKQILRVYRLKAPDVLWRRYVMPVLRWIKAVVLWHRYVKYLWLNANVIDYGGEFGVNFAKGNNPREKRRFWEETKLSIAQRWGVRPSDLYLVDNPDDERMPKVCVDVEGRRVELQYYDTGPRYIYNVVIAAIFQMVSVIGVMLFVIGIDYAFL